MLLARTQAECPSLAPGTIPDTFGVNHLCVSETKQEATLRKHSRSWGGIVLLLLFLISIRQKSFSLSHTAPALPERLQASLGNATCLSSPRGTQCLTLWAWPLTARPDTELTFSVSVVQHSLNNAIFTDSLAKCTCESLINSAFTLSITMKQ